MTTDNFDGTVNRDSESNGRSDNPADRDGLADLSNIPVSIGHCQTHGEFESRVIGLNGKPRPGRCPTCLAEIRTKEAAKRAAEEERQRKAREAEDRFPLEQAIFQADIPPRFSSRSLDNFTAETEGQRRALTISKRYADNFADRLANGGCLVFCGGPGTGKTHLACAIANHILPQGYTVVFRSTMDLIRRVRETYRHDSEKTERQVLEKYREPDLLIIDEVGVQYGTESEKIVLFEIINGRYGYVRPTILISNLPREGMEIYLGETIMGRMEECGGMVINCDWESYRKRVKRLNGDNGNGNGGAK